MEKLPVLIMALEMILEMTLGLAACGGNNDAPASTTEATVPVPSNVALVNKVANYTALLLPSNFGEFNDKDGNAVAECPNATIVVTPKFPSDTWTSNFTYDYMLESLVDRYSNIRVLAFGNAANISGVDSVSFV